MTSKVKFLLNSNIFFPFFQWINKEALTHISRLSIKLWSPWSPHPKQIDYIQVKILAQVFNNSEKYSPSCSIPMDKHHLRKIGIWHLNTVYVPLLFMLVHLSIVNSIFFSFQPSPFKEVDFSINEIFVWYTFPIISHCYLIIINQFKVNKTSLEYDRLDEFLAFFRDIDSRSRV